ncbi:AbrB/MazE/SpoVT family DNA-binding domain-containing protein, partial [Clostridioides difficile]
MCFKVSDKGTPTAAPAGLTWGIVRRIDDLGRVVIPKEIRKTLRIREGDPLEIFTAKDGEVIL